MKTRKRIERCELRTSDGLASKRIRLLAGALAIALVSGAARPLPAGLAWQPPRMEFDDEEPEIEGLRIDNSSSRRFDYQISRSSGPLWSGFYSLPAGKSHHYRAPQGRAAKAYGTLKTYGFVPGHLVIRFRESDGWVVHKLIADKAYIYVVNDDGFGELAEAPRDGRPRPITAPGDEDTRLGQLEANYAFQPDAAERPGPR